MRDKGWFRAPGSGWIKTAFQPETILFIAILLLAAGLRFIGLEQVPPGFNSDEAVGAVGALTTLERGPQLFYDGQGGGGSLGFWLLALSYALFGPSVAATRGTAAAAGLVAVAGLYFLAREMFRPALGERWARWLALAAMLLLATSPWHITTSRMAFAGVLVPMLQVPGAFFLWRGLRTGQRRHFVVSGVLLAALLYVYLAGAFVPLVYLFFFLIQAGVARAGGQRSGPPLLKKHFANLVWCAGIALALVLPAFYFYFAFPTQVAERAQEAFILNPLINQGDVWGAFVRSLRGNLTAFGVSLSWLLGRAPDNLVLPGPLGLATFLGLALALWRARRAEAGAPYLFTALWFGVMLLPSILSPDLIPHQLRALGAAPAVYLLAAIFFSELGRLALPLPAVKRAAPAWPRLGVGLILAVLAGWSAVGTYRQLFEYFVVWPQTNDAQAAFHVYAIEMARDMSAATDPEATFLLPLNTAAGDVAPNFTLLFFYRGAPDLAYVVDDERTIPADLSRVLDGQRRAHLVTWYVSKHKEADPKGVLPYYLEKHGHEVGRATYSQFETRTYELETAAADFAAAETLTPAAVRFADQVELIGFAFGNAGAVEAVTRPEAFSDDLLWVRLRWRELAPTPDDLKVTVLLQTGNGRPVSQIDQLLLNNIYHLRSRWWSPGEEEDTYLLLPVPPATPPGAYRLAVGIYTEDVPGRFPISRPAAAAGGADLALAPGNLVELGAVEVLPARQQPAIEALNLPLLLNEPLAPGLTLVGFGATLDGALRPGDERDVSVVWQATGRLDGDYRMSLRARDREGAEWTLAPAVDLAGPGYPTSAWQPGEVLRGWLPVRIPPAIASGQGDLWLQLEAAAGETPALRLPLGAFQVEGRERNFEAPTPQVQTGARLGDLVTLLGLDLSPARAAPGEALTLALYWRAEAELPLGYTGFVHLLGPDGQVHGQRDQVPGGGAYPTTGWLPGEIIRDEYRIEIPAGAPPGAYQIEIGLYDPRTGRRLPVGDADHVLAPGLNIVEE